MKKIGLCISGILMSTCFGMDPAQIKSLEDKRTEIQAQLDSLNEVLRRMHEETQPISEEISRKAQTIKAFEAELADLKKQKKEKAEEFDKKRIILAQEMKEFEDIIGVSQADQKTIDDLSNLFSKTSSIPNSNEKLSSKQQIINLQKKI